MRARYKGWCRSGKHPIKQGELIERAPKGWSHTACLNAAAPAHDYRACEEFDGEPHDAADHRADYQYRQGLGDGERYKAEKAIYGPALAEKFQAMDEFNRYWKYGEE